jgi:hypothetical protein
VNVSWIAFVNWKFGKSKWSSDSIRGLGLMIGCISKDSNSEWMSWGSTWSFSTANDSGC